jgi:hypothetical protein
MAAYSDLKGLVLVRHQRGDMWVGTPAECRWVGLRTVRVCRGLMLRQRIGVLSKLLL